MKLAEIDISQRTGLAAVGEFCSDSPAREHNKGTKIFSMIKNLLWKRSVHNQSWVKIWCLDFFPSAPIAANPMLADVMRTVNYPGLQIGRILRFKENGQSV